MLEQAYPHEPRGEAYLCLGLAEEVPPPLPPWLQAETLRELGRQAKERLGAPISLSWGTLIQASRDPR